MRAGAPPRRARRARSIRHAKLRFATSSAGTVRAGCARRARRRPRTVDRTNGSTHVLEVRVAAELVDGVPTVDRGAASASSGRVAREHAVGVDAVVGHVARRRGAERGGSGGRRHATRRVPRSRSGSRSPTRRGRRARPGSAPCEPRPSASRGAAAVGGQAVAHQRRACGAGPARRRPPTAGAPPPPPGRSPAPGCVRRADGLPRAGRARSDDVERPVGAPDERLDRGPGRVVGVEQRERRIDERGDRNRREAQQPARAGWVRASPTPARAAARRPGTSWRRPIPAATSSRPRAASSRTARSGTSGASSSGVTSGAPAPASVHLEPAAHHDPLRARRRAPAAPSARDRARLGARSGAARQAHPCRGLVDAEVHDGRGRELGDERDEPVTVARDRSA